MTDSPAAGHAGCHRPGPVLLLTPSRQKIDKEALIRKLLAVTPARVATAIFSPAAGWAFWTFKSEDFLKNSVDFRDHPPCTKC